MLYIEFPFLDDIPNTIFVMEYMCYVMFMDAYMYMIDDLWLYAHVFIIS